MATAQKQQVSRAEPAPVPIRLKPGVSGEDLYPKTWKGLFPKRTSAGFTGSVLNAFEKNRERSLYELVSDLEAVYPKRTRAALSRHISVVLTALVRQGSVVRIGKGHYRFVQRDYGRGAKGA